MLDAIVTYINDSLNEGVLSDDRFRSGRVYGIAEGLPRKKGDSFEIFPSVIDHHGEAEYVGVEGDFPFILYHKAVTMGFTRTVKSGQYGDSRGYQVQTTAMAMIVAGMRRRLKITADQLATYLVNNMPDTMDKAMMKSRQFNTVNINVQSVVLNTVQVFQEEYQNIAFFLKPEQYLFKINYSIESTYLKECFTKCVDCK